MWEGKEGSFVEVWYEFGVADWGGILEMCMARRTVRGGGSGV